MDPFGGGGSTYQAAEKNDRYWIGVELFDSAHIKKRFEENFPDIINRKPIYPFKEIFKTV